MRGGELLVAPAVADGDAEFLEPVEKLCEFLVGKCAAGDAFIQQERADECLAVVDRERDGAAEGLEFAADLAVTTDFGAIGAEDAAMLREVPPEAAGETEREVLHERGVVPDGVCGAQPLVVGRGRAVRGERAGLAEKDGGAVHAKGLAKLLDGVADEFADVQAVDEERGKMAECIEAAAWRVRGGEGG